MRDRFVIAALAWTIAIYVIVAIDLGASAAGWKARQFPQVRITSGPHAGRSGMIVSAPWIGNGYNLRASVNVPSSTGRREWVNVWGWEIERAKTGQ